VHTIVRSKGQYGYEVSKEVCDNLYDAMEYLYSRGAPQSRPHFFKPLISRPQLFLLDLRYKLVKKDQSWAGHLTPSYDTVERDLRRV